MIRQVRESEVSFQNTRLRHILFLISKPQRRKGEVALRSDFLRLKVLTSALTATCCNSAICFPHIHGHRVEFPPACTIAFFINPRYEHTADMESECISELISDFARLPSIMVIGEDRQTLSTSSEPLRTSSYAPHDGVRPTPPVAVPQSREGPHIRFRGATPQHSQEHEEEHPHGQQNRLLPQESHPGADGPPPSPRLEPTHRSTLSLNGSVANSPSRIKVRDLGHIQSFASEELLTKSRHPSRHSLRGRLAGAQQYEISAMPVADIIEMVAGLLTKITTTVRALQASTILCLQVC